MGGTGGRSEGSSRAVPSADNCMRLGQCRDVTANVDVAAVRLTRVGIVVKEGKVANVE